MITFKKKPRILYLHGLGEEVRFPGGGEVFKEIKKYLDVDFLNYSSEPDQGWKDFNLVKFEDYSLIVGFSLGGVYACCQSKVPVVLINPGFGVSRKYEGFKKIDDLSLRVDKDLVRSILVGERDKHKENYMPGIKQRGLMDKVVYFPSEHVPEMNEIKKYIIPEIKKYL